MPKRKGPLVVIGGHEEKSEGKDRAILEIVARPARRKGGRVVIVTTASHQVPRELGEDYTKVFGELGAKNIDVLDIRTRDQAYDPATVRKLDHANVIFFTGGDQLRITSQLGGTPVFQKMLEIHNAGGMIAATSAGAAAMPETMLIYGSSESSSTISGVGMAPGLGLLKGVVVDSHFAERGRIGRLLGAVAQNPYNLGVGIDEDTAICVADERQFTVIGSGGVYVADGSRISYSSLSEDQPEGVLSIFNLKLHILGHKDRFDLHARKPIAPDTNGSVKRAALAKQKA
jgi:cyanophycinase